MLASLWTSLQCKDVRALNFTRPKVRCFKHSATYQSLLSGSHVLCCPQLRARHVPDCPACHSLSCCMLSMLGCALRQRARRSSCCRWLPAAPSSSCTPSFSTSPTSLSSKHSTAQRTAQRQLPCLCIPASPQNRACRLAGAAGAAGAAHGRRLLRGCHSAALVRASVDGLAMLDGSKPVADGSCMLVTLERASQQTAGWCSVFRPAGA